MTVRDYTCVDHTYGPGGYVEWHNWAERKLRTHDCEQCDECLLWLIWTPKEKR